MSEFRTLHAQGRQWVDVDDLYRLLTEEVEVTSSLVPPMLAVQTARDRLFARITEQFK